VFTTDVIGIRSLEFHPDGHAYMVLPEVTLHPIYAVNGNLYTDLTGNGAFARQIPATYYWYFDGSNLTFQLMSEDLVWSRERDFNGNVYTLTNEPLPARDSESKLIEFPTGTFVLDGSRYYAMELKDDGTWNAYESEGATPAASGKYVTHGYLYTEMTHNYPDARQVPVTYNWTYDGRNLTFELEGYIDFEDVIPERKALFDGQTYIKTDLKETSPIEPGDTERSVIVNDLERSYLLHIPPGIDSQQPVPLVFAFHGWTLRPVDLQMTAGFDDLADQSSYLVVYPAGVGNSWNTREEGPGITIAHNVDESAFVKAILSDLETMATIDPKRIYAAGRSMGGALAYRLACEMSDTFAAIASVAGPMEYHSCQPQQAVSVIHIHGLADKSVPFSGGGEHNLQPVENGLETWVELNHCPSAAEERDEEKGINHLAYAPCQGETGVELYTSDSGIHPIYSFGPVGIPASEIIWEFFVAHPKP
jgi:polyhydroxybutyrate depolymerase